MMDFAVVKRQIISEYLCLYDENKSTQWDLQSCICLFAEYYERYRKTFGVDHPHLSNESIRKCIREVVEPEYDCLNYVGLDGYIAMIESYFQQPFRNCNYSFIHFLSGDIRKLRYYEELY